MIEKRFESRQSINKTGYVVTDNKKQYTFPVMSENDCFMFCKVLNALHEENQRLKSRVSYVERKIQRERISAMKEHEKWEKEILKENEQLKQENKELEKFRYNVFKRIGEIND